MKTTYLTKKDNECETYGTCFRYQGNLSRHEKTIHLNQEEHKRETCWICFG